MRTIRFFATTALMLTLASAADAQLVVDEGGAVDADRNEGNVVLAGVRATL